MAQSISPAATGYALMVVSQGRRSEPVLAKAGRYRSNLGVGVGPGISKMRYYLLAWEMLDALRLRKHASPSGALSEGAPCARLREPKL